MGHHRSRARVLLSRLRCWWRTMGLHQVDLRGQCQICHRVEPTSNHNAASPTRGAPSEASARRNLLADIEVGSRDGVAEQR